MSTKIFVHPTPVRLWHWIHAVGIVLLVLTGAQIRYAGQLDVISLQNAISIHNYVGFVVLFDYLVWLAFYLGTGRIKTYIPNLRTLHRDAFRQVKYYGYGIFRGDPNPHTMTPENKFNPMQQMAYVQLMFIFLPLQIMSGLFLWQVKRYGDYIELLGGVKVVDTIHVLLFFFFASFLIVHCYLATLGHTPLAHFKSMFTGYEDAHGQESEVAAGELSIHGSAAYYSPNYPGKKESTTMIRVKNIPAVRKGAS